MLKKTSTSALLLFILHYAASAQFHFAIGMNMGGTQLIHDTRFQDTPLHPLYETIENTHPEGYTWDQFKKDFDLRDAYLQPRFGFSAHLSYRNWPLAIIGEAMSSPSTYTKMAYSGTILLGQKFDIGDSDFFFSAHAGYKFVRDFGFGSGTLVNSIRDDDQRSLVSQYFDPKQPLGPQTGQLFTIRLGFGQTFGANDQVSAGIETIGELDLTDKTARRGNARMTNLGLQLYARFGFDFSFRSANVFYPNPGGSRSTGSGNIRGTTIRQ